MNIQEEYDKGRRNFSYMRLEGANLSGTNLSGADFACTDLKNANLTDADLSATYFGGAKLRGVVFTRATLDDSDFTGADLNGAVLTKVELTDAIFNHANLENSTIHEAKFRHSELVGTDLENANLKGTDFTGTKFTWANLTNTNFAGAILTRTCLDPKAIIPPLTDEEILTAGLEIDGEWVYGWRTEWSLLLKHKRYIPRKEPYIAEVFSVDQRTPCHPGIYLASRKWIAAQYGKHASVVHGEYSSVVRCRCKRNELIHAGDKWRTKRLWIEEKKE